LVAVVLVVVVAAAVAAVLEVLEPIFLELQDQLAQVIQ
jgi:hypothetical protein|tara:strand:- start:535 stop:648 length:114 start_codon:yes stop_codon:yes gene_type:complete